MKVDMDLARSEYNFNSGQHRGANFARFSPAYATTNEDIREALSLSMHPTPGMRVLTVAGSGDQPLQYKLAGASQIDTFDITFNAKMMMDIKTTAIKHLSHLDYKILVRQSGHVENISDIPQYQQIARHMPEDTQKYIRDMRGAYLVRHGMCYDMLNQNEFEKLKSMPHRPFNFIWTDLEHLSSHLTQQYDQIYLSNILQYHARPEYVTPLIMDLSRFLAPNGTMLINISPFFADDDMAVVRDLTRHVEKNNIGTVKYIHNHLYDACLLKKR